MSFDIKQHVAMLIDAWQNQTSAQHLKWTRVEKSSHRLDSQEAAKRV